MRLTDEAQLGFVRPEFDVGKSFLPYGEPSSTDDIPADLKAP
jgi:hypothetical protein